MGVRTINRLMLKGTQEEMEQLKLYDQEGSWIVRPFKYKLGYDGYYRERFTSYLGGSQENLVRRDLFKLSKAFPNTRLIYTWFVDYGEPPIESYYTDVFEAGKEYSIGYGSMKDFYDNDTFFYKFGLNLNMEAEEVAKTLKFNDELDNGGYKPICFPYQGYIPYKKSSLYKQENMLPNFSD